MKHLLKIEPQYYCRVADGSKTFELRENDRGFQNGDVVVLSEWDPSPQSANSNTPKGYTGAPDLIFTVGYILVLNSHQVIFSLLPAEPAKQITPPSKTKKKSKS